LAALGRILLQYVLSNSSEVLSISGGVWQGSTGLDIIYSGCSTGRGRGSTVTGQRYIFGRDSGAAGSSASHYEVVSGQVSARGAVCSRGLGMGSLEPMDGGRSDHNTVQTGT
jgi:hypothetical protein